MTVPKNTYVGRRYVPKLFQNPNDGTATWTSSIAHESLTVVMWQGASYTSKQDVPVGIDISDVRYWTRSADYNAQISIYEQNVRDYHQFVLEEISEINNSYTAFTNNINNEYDSFTIEINETLNTKISNITINVKSYGAVGDGITDDTTAIQNAINNTICGNIYFPKGTYLIGSILLHNNIKITFDNNAIIKTKSGVGIEVFTIQNCDNVQIEGGIFDSNSANMYIFHGYIYVKNSTNIKIKNSTFKLSTSAGIGIEDSTNVYVSDCTCIDTAIGVYSKNTSKLFIYDNIIYKTTAPTDATTTQIRGIKLITCEKAIIKSNYVKNYDIGIELFNLCLDIAVNDNIVITYFGISIDQSSNVICRGNIVKNTPDSVKFLVGIEVAQGNNVTMTNNQIYIDTTINASDMKAIHLAPSGTNQITNKNIIISDNMCVGNFNNSIFVYCADTLIISNNIFNGQHCGILIQTASSYNSAITTNVKINNNKFYGSDTNKNYALYITNTANNVSFYRNEIVNHNGAIYMIKSIGCNNINIEGNYIYNSNNFAIDIENNLDGTNSYTTTPNNNIKINNNNIDIASNRAVLLVGIPNLIVKGNNISNSQKSGLYVLQPTNANSISIIKDNYSTNNCLTTTAYEGGIVLNNIVTNTIAIITNNVAINNNNSTGLYLQGTQSGNIVNTNNISSTGFGIS